MFEGKTGVTGRDVFVAEAPPGRPQGSKVALAFTEEVQTLIFWIILLPSVD